MARGAIEIGWTLAGRLSIFWMPSAAAHPGPPPMRFASPVESGGGLGLVALLVFKTSVAPNPC